MLKRIGAYGVKKIYRGSYVLAGRVGLSGAQWRVKQVQKARYKGPSIIQFYYGRPRKHPGKRIKAILVYVGWTSKLSIF